MKYKILIVYWVEVGMALVVNSCILLFYLKIPNTKKTVSDIFLINLIVSDLLTALAATVALGQHIRRATIEAENAITLFMYIYTATLISCLISVLLVTADRFIAIIYPYRYGTLLCRRKVRFILIVTWVFSLITVLSGTVLATVEHSKIINIANAGLIYIIIIIALIGIIFLVVTNAIILREVRRQIRTIKSISVFGDEATSKQQMDKLRKKENRATYLCFAIAATFVVTWCPLVAGLIYKLIDNRPDNKTANDLMDTGKYLILLGITVNPCLYVPFKSELRKRLKFLPFCRCRKNSEKENETKSSSTDENNTSL